MCCKVFPCAAASIDFKVNKKNRQRAEKKTKYSNRDKIWYLRHLFKGSFDGSLFS